MIDYKVDLFTIFCNSYNFILFLQCINMYNNILQLIDLFYNT